MTNITNRISNILHRSIWSYMSDMQENNYYSYSNEMDRLQETYVVPIEDFIYSIPYGASHTDVANIFI